VEGGDPPAGSSLPHNPHASHPFSTTIDETHTTLTVGASTMQAVGKGLIRTWRATRPGNVSARSGQDFAMAKFVTCLALSELTSTQSTDCFSGRVALPVLMYESA